MSELSFDLQKGLVGHWTMDDADTSGGTLYDSSAYDNHGTIGNGVTIGSSGILNESFSFDQSSNAQIDVTTTDSLIQPCTITTWINSNVIGSSDNTIAPGICSVDSIGDYNNYVSFIRSDQIDAEASGDVDTKIRVEPANGSRILSNEFTYKTGEWVHIAVVSIDSSTTKFYYNGDAIGTRTDPVDQYDVNWIGKGYEGATNGGALDGKLNDFRIYDRALSERGINALYNMRSQRLANL